MAKKTPKADESVKERTTIYIRRNLWKKLRKLALDEEKSASEIVEELIEKKLGGSRGI